MQLLAEQRQPGVRSQVWSAHTAIEAYYLQLKFVLAVFVNMPMEISLHSMKSVNSARRKTSISFNRSRFGTPRMHTHRARSCYPTKTRFVR